MPVRPRRPRRLKTALTVQRAVSLEIGPRSHDEDLELLREVFLEHRRRFDDACWAVAYFENAIDNTEKNAINTEENAIAELSGRALDLAVGLPGPWLAL